MKTQTNGHKRTKPTGSVVALKNGAQSNLSLAEQTDLADCEVVIERGWQTFVEVGTALAKIQNNRLYRHKYGSFDDYCKVRWMVRRSYAYSLIAAAEAVKHLSAIADTSKPLREAQVRPLIGMEPDRMKSAWAKAIELAKSEPVTARHVKLAVAQLNGTSAAKTVKKKRKAPQGGLHYVLELIEQAEQSINDHMGTISTLGLLARIKSCVSEVIND